jgi:prevent-host-death family protein
MEVVMVEILTANEAKTNFGELLLKTQRMPVQITRSGKPVAVVMSSKDYDIIEEFKMRYLKEELAHSLADETAGRIEDYDSFFNDLMAGKYD